ncbi:UV DNA damage repair endonuclease UvsE [Mobilitalea sibirica]|uniref:UV DNA damage repair endonuclease UvsE n=1 Tax=Mobilitalea sibirica TaxID=1462919 RepID=A0A8J7L088_9FIRM|nr:UV DNA damage repair endonuclease UvsE [Mobilitalea sibirica]MBH1941853.1 UV DNA damage repair endonuclease UvsE [Mobilitalea sibirica]
MAIGYACITIGVQDTGLSRCILKNATEDNIRRITLANLSALEKMIDYNIKMGIKLFRISSDIIPFGSHPENQIRWWEEYREVFSAIGDKIIKSGMRVSMHPGQYTVLNAPNPQVVENAIRDLQYHDRFLTALGMDQKCKLVLHIGGVYGDKEKASKAFIHNYGYLPQNIKDRLIIENDDKNYTIEEVLKISHAIGAPVVFDNLHHEVNPPIEQLSEEAWIMESQKTWKTKDGRQKIHYSQQKDGGSKGAHSDTIFVEKFMKFIDKLSDKDIDIMLEVKDKNLSAIKCINTAVLNVRAKYLEEEWARYKYYVLSRSAKLYNEIRTLLKEKEEYVAKEFYEKVEQAILMNEDRGAQINAAQHVWGYISKDSTAAEKNRYEKLLNAYQREHGEIKTLKKHLLKCANVRGIDYLINSIYFYL